jgi:hypothetical protein
VAVPSDGASERHQKMPRLGLGACRGIMARMRWSALPDVVVLRGRG